MERRKDLVQFCQGWRCYPALLPLLPIRRGKGRLEKSYQKLKECPTEVRPGCPYILNKGVGNLRRSNAAGRPILNRSINPSVFQQGHLYSWTALPTIP